MGTFGGGIKYSNIVKGGPEHACTLIEQSIVLYYSNRTVN